MTPEERDLIAGLFERMRGMGAIDKDREAEDLIARSVRQVPDAAYMLVQSVLVQEHALQEAGARIEELEDRMRDLERGQQRSSGSGGFLGGVFGGGRGTEQRSSGSVPAIGSRAAAPAYDRTQSGPGGSPWAQRPAASAQAAEPPRGGGGFLKGAMATAAGVAGGMLLADSIRGMLGGEAGKAQAATGSEAKPEDAKAESSPYEVNQKEETKQESHYQDPEDNDPGNYEDASWGGDSDGGDGFDI
jgi:hypothetical protein